MSEQEEQPARRAAGSSSILQAVADGGEEIEAAPTGRTDGDVTMWEYDDASGQEIGKTYADGGRVIKTYDGFGNLAAETNARGVVKTMAYDTATGELTGVSFSDGTQERSFAYNVQGQVMEVKDAAGTRRLGYNEYGEPETESLEAEGTEHLVTEIRDGYGRSAGFTYARNGESLHAVFTKYGEDGRISAAGFVHGGGEKEFSYGYLAGTNLLETLTMPNGMTLTQSYEEKRDLPAEMTYRRGTTGVVIRNCAYDTPGRPLTRKTARQGGTREDTFTHNGRSELTAAVLGSDAYAYAYDNIGSRRTARESEEELAYETNALNQYTSIARAREEETFEPEYDADGSQTRVRTSKTDIWKVTYDAENRLVRFESEDGVTVAECDYDCMGRRRTKKVTAK